MTKLEAGSLSTEPNHKMGNCCKKTKIVEDEDAEDENLAFYDGQNNRFVWDDENKQGFTKTDNGHHYTQDDDDPALFWDDKNPIVCLDIGGIEEDVVLDEQGVLSVVNVTPITAPTPRSKKAATFDQSFQESTQLSNLPDESETIGSPTEADGDDEDENLEESYNKRKSKRPKKSSMKSRRQTERKRMRGKGTGRTAKRITKKLLRAGKGKRAFKRRLMKGRTSPKRVTSFFGAGQRGGVGGGRAGGDVYGGRSVRAPGGPGIADMAGMAGGFAGRRRGGGGGRLGLLLNVMDMAGAMGGAGGQRGGGGFLGRGRMAGGYYDDSGYGYDNNYQRRY